MRSLFIGIGLFIFTHSFLETKAQVIRYDHDANQFEGFTDISLKEGTLTFESGSSRGGFIVIESDAPIILISTHNVVVELSPGWDGSLGYKLYGIRFRVAQPGSGEIQLQKIEPPDQAIPTSGEEIEEFKKSTCFETLKIPG